MASPNDTPDFATIEEIAAALGISLEQAQQRADAEGWPFIDLNEVPEVKH